MKGEKKTIEKRSDRGMGGQQENNKGRQMAA